LIFPESIRAVQQKLLWVVAATSSAVKGIHRACGEERISPRWVV